MTSMAALGAADSLLFSMGHHISPRGVNHDLFAVILIRILHCNNVAPLYSKAENFASIGMRRKSYSARIKPMVALNMLRALVAPQRVSERARTKQRPRPEPVTRIIPR